MLKKSSYIIMNKKIILKILAKANIIGYFSLISRIILRLTKVKLNKSFSTNKKTQIQISKCFQRFSLSIVQFQQNDAIQLHNTQMFKLIRGENKCRTVIKEKDVLTKTKNLSINLEINVVCSNLKQLPSLEKESIHICITADDISFFFGNENVSEFEVSKECRLGLEILHQKCAHVDKNLDKNEYESNNNKNDDSTLLSDLLKNRHFKIKPENLLVYMQPGSDVWHPVSIDDIPWAWLKEEKWRLHTFAKYPHISAKSALLLAADGFAYIGVGRGLDDNVICYFCCATKNNWRPSDVISDVHKQLSPQCPMATGIICGNIPMTSPNGGAALFNKIYHEQRSANLAESTLKSRNNGVETDSQVSQNAPENNVTSGITFATSTVNRPPLPQQAYVEHGNANFTTPHQPSENNAPSSTITSSNVTVWQSNESNIPVRFRQTVRQASNRNDRPDRTESSSLGSPDSTTNARTRSSPSNPNLRDSQPENQAASPQLETDSATSDSDRLGNQVSASGTSQNGTKAEGPTYAQLGIITERPKRYEYAVITKRLETFENWPRDHHLEKEDLAEAGFYYAGYGDCARCFYCGGGLRNWEVDDDVWVEHARWFPKCAFIRQQMGQVFVDTVQELNKTFDQIPFAMVSDKIGKPASVFHLDSKDTPLKRDAAVRTVVGMGFNLKDVILAAESIKDEVGILSADKIYEKLMQDNKSRNANAEYTSLDIGSSKDGVEKNLETIRILKEQNNQLRQQTVCKICMDKEVAIVFLPCGHLVSCNDCAAAMKDCPVCRNSVKGVVRAFMG